MSVKTEDRLLAYITAAATIAGGVLHLLIIGPFLKPSNFPIGPPDLKNRVWISLEEEESFSSWIALPGHKNLGMGRHWHFFSIIFWITLPEAKWEEAEMGPRS